GRQVPGQGRPPSLSKSSSEAEPPSLSDGSHDAYHGRTSPSAATHHAGIPVEPPLPCWNVSPARRRRLRARSHLERNCFGVGTAEGLTHRGLQEPISVSRSPRLPISDYQTLPAIVASSDWLTLAA